SAANPTIQNPSSEGIAGRSARRPLDRSSQTLPSPTSRGVAASVATDSAPRRFAAVTTAGTPGAPPPARAAPPPRLPRSRACPTRLPMSGVCRKRLPAHQLLERWLVPDRVEVRVPGRERASLLRVLDRDAEVLDRIGLPPREALAAGDVVEEHRVLRIGLGQLA